MFTETTETRPIANPNDVIQIMLEQLAILKLMYTSHIFIPEGSGVPEDDCK